MPGLIVTLGGSSTPYEQMLARSVTQAKAAGVAIQREYAKAQTMIGSASFKNFNSATSLGTAATSTVLNSREAKTAAQEYGELWKDALSKQEAGIRAVRMEQLALLAASAKGNFGQGIHGTGAGGGISGIMRETLVIFREIGRGNMTRVPGSLLLLLQYTGMLNLMMKGEKTEALLAAAAQEKLAKSTARAALAAEAKVRAQQILEAEDAYLAKQMDDLDKELHPETVYEMRDLRLDLALYADRVTLDGKAYYHGELYTVPKPVYDVLKECEARTWRHDDEIRSGDTNDAFYRKSRQMSVNMRTGVTTAAGAPLRF